MTLLWTGHRDNFAADAQAGADTLKRLSARPTLESRLRSDENRPPQTRLRPQIRAAANHDLSAALAQLEHTYRQVDHDQNAKLDKLSQRPRQEPTGRIADAAPKADKQAGIEFTPAPPQPAGATPTAAWTSTPLAAAKPDVGASPDPTGSIERPDSDGGLRRHRRARRRGAAAPAGPQEVSPGDYLPGIGQVERIEKHGKEWAVDVAGRRPKRIAAQPPYCRPPSFMRRRTMTSNPEATNPCGAWGADRHLAARNIDHSRSCLRSKSDGAA